MITIDALKSQELKEKVKKSLRFQALPKVEQEALLYMMSSLPENLQEKSLNKFFAKENRNEQKVRRAKHKAYLQFMENFKLAQFKIDKIAAKDKEITEEKMEKEKSDNLLKSLE